MKRYTKSLCRLIENSELDNETKQNIIDLKEKVKEIFDIVMDKELKRQKKSGKEFLSDEDIDNLFDDKF